VENVAVMPPGSDKVVVQDVSLSLAGGQRARHHRAERIGQEFAGARAGRRVAPGPRPHPPGRRRARQWSPESLGKHIGYLPQDVELLAGTVAQNIGRFTHPLDPRAVIAAATAAGVP
jgi:ATP-binding cassette subfamily C protein